MTPVRTALYLDFDNVFSGLTKLDPEAAVLFAQNPTLWLDQLAETLTVEGPRRWLILRCYMNPSGWVPRPSSSERQYFSQFRQSFTSAGFEVIDCPRLAHTKNAADIRLVVDALDALTGQVRYDEFIVASGDSDMTPLLVRLRADDRRVTLLSPFDAVEALAAVADRLINGQQLLELLQREEEAPGDIAQFREVIRRRYEMADKPINLSALAHEVREELGPDVANGWFGARSFARAVEGLALPNAELAGHYLWDTKRHQPPLPANTQAAAPGPVALPPSVGRLAGPLGIPRLSSAAWPAIVDVLAKYASTHHFNMTEATAWSRDRLEEDGVNVARAAVGFAVRATAYGGHPLYHDPAPTSDEIMEALVSNVLSRAAAAELDLSADEAAELRAWFGGNGRS